MSMSEAIDELLAYEHIRQLAARYAVAVDSRNIADLVALFIDDVQVGRNSFGREALAASFDKSLSEIGVSMLNVGTHVIDLLDADNATGLVYCHAQIQDNEHWIHQYILYRDTYARRGGQWFFVRRIHELWYGAEASENPMQLPPANWPVHHDGRGTVPESFPSWNEFQKRISGQ